LFAAIPTAPWFDFVFHASNLSCAGSGSPGRTNCGAQHRERGAAQHGFQLLLRRATEPPRHTWKKNRWRRKCASPRKRWFSNDVVVRRVILAELVLEILHALVEAINLLHRPRPLEIKIRLVQVACGRLPKVVSTATSDWRTWKVNSSSANITTSTAAMMT